MKLIDTHCHLYLNNYDVDRALVIQNALHAGIQHILLPNIDSTSWQPMLNLATDYPQLCFPMAGLHPTSVIPQTIDNELFLVKKQLEQNKYCAVGEIGIDLYWDKTHLQLQEEVFREQLLLAKQYRLPVAIHVRDSFNEVWRILKQELTSEMKGVFHCFPGNEFQARQVIETGFKLGIGGVVTFKNSHMQQVVKSTDLKHIVLETDAPFLTPAPYRGKRNEPAYTSIIAAQVAALKSLTIEEVAAQTTQNAVELFGL
jgi:TatD DNase family protein